MRRVVRITIHLLMLSPLNSNAVINSMHVSIAIMNQKIMHLCHGQNQNSMNMRFYVVYVTPHCQSRNIWKQTIVRTVMRNSIQDALHIILYTLTFKVTVYKLMTI